MERRATRDEKSFGKLDIYKKHINEILTINKRRKRRKAF